tara:strand:- start:4895 stop:5908 length:1014 start_codon:yes stop_codon:yes gene_type:complete
MKICFISENFSPSYGGQFSSIKGIIDMCKLRNIDHIVIHKKSKIYSDKNNLENTIKKCDIIHIFGGWTYFYVKASLLAHKLRKKIIIHPMGFYEPWSLSQKKIKKTLAWHIYQKNFLQKADIIHCASKNEELNLKKLNLKTKTVVLPFGINKKDIKKDISQKMNKRCIFLSRLHKKKGLDILIEAWKELKNKDWNLDIVGYGNQTYYKNKIESDSVTNIKFLKPISNTNRKNKLFDNYDFLVLPSLNENFGIVILESLSRGLPVLTTNETPWEVIQNKNAGWLINYSSIELKLVLNQIFNTKKKQFFIKKKNAIKIANDFNKEKLSNEYYKVYRKLI